MRKFEGRVALIVTLWAVAAALFHLYAVVEYVKTTVLSSVHLLSCLSLGFLLYPATSKSPKDRPTVIDVGLALIAVAGAMYPTIRSTYVEQRLYLADPLSTFEIIIGTIYILLVVEATRRMVNSVMAIIVGAAVMHVAIGPYLFGILQHPGFSYQRIVEIFYLNLDQGIFGMLTSISSSYLILFVIFGAFIAQSGVGDFFNELAFRIAGKSPGGPAKVSIWSSGFFGMVSGMGTANVYTTGSFTIPMMKKYGYEPEFAGAVEATASTGGQYMPPIMGAAAFIMAEMIGVPYLKLAVYASLSAVLFYFSMAFCIHLAARKRHLGAVTGINGKIVSWKNILKRSYSLASLVGIVVLLVAGFSPMYAGFFGIIIVIVGSFLDKRDKWMTFRRILKALENGVKNTVMVAAACAGAGIVVSSIAHTAFGVSFVSLIMNLSGGYLFIAILLTAMLSLILGIGMPTTPAYILASSLAAPVLTEYGVDIVAAHLFVLYFAKIAEVTPPVAVCAYAAASIAKGDSFKTGIQAQKLAISGYILPIAFVYNTALIFKGTTDQIMISIVLSLVGLWLVNGGIEGWMYRKLNPLTRIIFCGLGCITFVTNHYIGALAAITGIIYVVILRIKEPKSEKIINAVGSFET